MSYLSFDRFLSWAESRFGDVVVNGNEIRFNSPFTEDYKRHLWANVYGGKKGSERPYGVYRCFKTDKKGTLVGLVQSVDHCTFEEALAILEGGLSIYELQDEVNRLFMKEPEEGMFPVAGIPFPEGTFRITDLPENDSYRCSAEAYLLGRGLSIGRMLVCKEGIYSDRIIIPYYDANGVLIYWNGRYIGNVKNVARYLGPDKSIGVGKADVVYMSGGIWASKGSKLYLTEGEFCAESFRVAGLASGAFGGKTLSEKQAEMLRGYNLCLCLDNDSSGDKALGNIGEKISRFGFDNLSYLKPPVNYKDWNQLMLKTNPSVLQLYVEKFEKPYDSWTNMDRDLKKI